MDESNDDDARHISTRATRERDEEGERAPSNPSTQRRFDDG